MDSSTSKGNGSPPLAARSGADDPSDRRGNRLFRQNGTPIRQRDEKASQHMILILKSALKHGIDEIDILQVWNRYLAQFREREEPIKYIRIRFDTKVRLLEVGGEITGDTTKIFHAMPARPKYTRRIKL